MGDSQDSLGGLGPHDANPFPFLTDVWGVHDSVLGILNLFGEPSKQVYTEEEAKAFRYHFDFIGTVLECDVMEVLDVFSDAVTADVTHPLQITFMLCGEN